METVQFGVIGGSGFYKIKNLLNQSYIRMKTPFGFPTEKILVGELDGKLIAFISRHGIGHRYNPSEVNYRANLFALRMLNVERLISITAVGSLKEELAPTDLVIPDQYVDNSYQRHKTFFEDGVVAHVSMSEPTCHHLTDMACAAAREIGVKVHKGGTYFNMEGPQFSSKAESHTYRSFGFSVIGMTQAIEAKLAKELEMCFLPFAFVTDYDCWHQDAESVNVDIIIENLNKNTENAHNLIELLIKKIPRDRSECNCQHSLENSIITNPEKIPGRILKKLKPVIGKYLR